MDTELLGEFDIETVIVDDCDGDDDGLYVLVVVIVNDGLFDGVEVTETVGLALGDMEFDIEGDNDREILGLGDDVCDVEMQIVVVMVTDGALDAVYDSVTDGDGEEECDPDPVRVPDTVGELLLEPVGHAENVLESVFVTVLETLTLTVRDPEKVPDTDQLSESVADTDSEPVAEVDGVTEVDPHGLWLVETESELDKVPVPVCEMEPVKEGVDVIELHPDVVDETDVDGDAFGDEDTNPQKAATDDDVS